MPILRNATVLLLLLTLSACDQQKTSNAAAKLNRPTDHSETAGATPTSVPAAAVEIGRYTIIHSPLLEADTMLLDTATGRTWQLQKGTIYNGDPLIWTEIYRLDTPADYYNMNALYGLKKPKPTTGPSPKPAQ